MDSIGAYEWWCEMYKHILLRCTALITFGKWQRSNGATQEVELAILNRIPVFHNFPELHMWHKEQLK